MSFIPIWQKDESPTSVSELNLENVGGIFMVLLIGIVLGGAMAAAEHFWWQFWSNLFFLITDAFVKIMFFQVYKKHC